MYNIFISEILIFLGGGGGSGSQVARNHLRLPAAGGKVAFPLQERDLAPGAWSGVLEVPVSGQPVHPSREGCDLVPPPAMEEFSAWSIVAARSLRLASPEVALEGPF